MRLVDECDETGSRGEPLFRHTECSQELRIRSEWNTRTLALVHLSPAQIRPWWQIYEALTGTEEVEPFRLEHGRGVFEFYEDPANSEAAARFDNLMMELSAWSEEDDSERSAAELIAELPVWQELMASGSATPTVIDVGGGLGQVLAAVLTQHRGLHGVLFDRPSAISSPDLVPELRGVLSSRVDLVGGDFVGEEAALPGGDVYVLKWILHDWNDTMCMVILGKIRAAMLASDRPAGQLRPRLLVVERVVAEEASGAGDEGDGPAAGEPKKLNDACMWVIYGGQERTQSQFTELLGSQGFTVERVTPFLALDLVVLEAVLTA